MKKIIAFILILNISLIPLYSEEINPEPYTQEEFSPILLDVRRATIVFCGAFPLGYMYSTIIGDQFLNNYSELEGLDDVERSNKEIEIKLISSLVFSGVIMLIDLIIEKFFKG